MRTYFAAADLRLNPLADGLLKGLEVGRATHLYIEVAAIDRSQFNCEPQTLPLGRGVAKAGHAVNGDSLVHNRFSWIEVTT